MRIGHGADKYGDYLEDGRATPSERLQRLKANPRQLKDRSLFNRLCHIAE